MGHSRNDEAIKLAVQGRWKEAVATNQEILEISPNDIDSLNRLGKALSELGRNAKSRKAYERVLELDPHNSIARRNRFIEETNKARRVTLH
jgi:Flp pilus assembly protein TadD